MDEDQPKVTRNPQPAQTGPYAITLPCPPEEFGDFISSLLGRAQTIEKRFHGTFLLTRDHIQNVFHLVDQRVHQQNEATLIQFTVTILYDDDSSVMLNDLTDFLHYNEVHPLVSVGVDLSWTYLIRFQDKKHPEKQTIELALRSRPTVVREIRVGLTGERAIFEMGDAIHLSISHTARSWGVDMESLMTGHIKTWLLEDPPTPRFIIRHNGALAVVIWLIIMVSSVSYFTSKESAFVNARKVAAREAIVAAAKTPGALDDRVNFLMNSLVINPKDVVDMQFFVSTIATFIVATILCIWIASLADNQSQSFVLLSNKAQEAKRTFEEQRRRNWKLLALSIALAIATGLLSNVIFYYFAKHWQF